MIYLDNAATSKCFPQTAALMLPYFSDNFFNPSAAYSTEICQKIEQSRANIAQILNCNPYEVYFMSGATEANNLAVFSGYKSKNSEIIVSEGEHPSVYLCAKALQNKGHTVHFVPILKSGSIDTDALFCKITKQTAFVSIMHINNETGAINDIQQIAQKIKQINNKTIIHCDGVQAFCKLPVDLKDIDLYSISAHKICGPKGIGALYIKKGLSISPLLLGGGQEKKMRAGTENVCGIVGFADAAQRYCELYNKQKMLDLKQCFLNAAKHIKNFCLTSDDNCIPNIISISSVGAKAEVIQSALAESGIFIGLGSACSTKQKGNRVLQAMGLDQKTIVGSMRLSLSVDTTKDDLICAAQKIANLAERF